MFQQVFMDYNDSVSSNLWKTIAHGDFHPGNIFFDRNTSRIYFIDNETMSQFLDKSAGISEDFEKFIFLPLKLWRNIWDSEWDKIVQFYIYYIKGYVESFAQDKRKSINNYVMDLIVRDISGLLGSDYYGNEERVKLKKFK